MKKASISSPTETFSFKEPPNNFVSYVSDGETPLERAMIKMVETLGGRRHLQGLYDSMRHLPLTGTDFWGAALDALDINLNVDLDRIKQLKDSGPLVVIANHPFGVVDGLALCHLTAQIHPDFKVILHKVLCRDERVATHVLPIDFTPSRAATRNNVRTKQKAIKTLKEGGIVVIFPAGGVSTAPKPFFSRATDLDWKPLTTKLIQSAGASVLPIYFHGQNSWLFQLASQFSQNLRLGMLLHEVHNKIGKTLDVEIGELIPYDRLEEACEDRDSITRYLRDTLYSLSYQNVLGAT